MGCWCVCCAPSTMLFCTHVDSMCQAALTRVCVVHGVCSCAANRQQGTQDDQQAPAGVSTGMRIIDVSMRPLQCTTHGLGSQGSIAPNLRDTPPPHFAGCFMTRKACYMRSTAVESWPGLVGTALCSKPYGVHHPSHLRPPHEA